MNTKTLFLGIGLFFLMTSPAFTEVRDDPYKLFEEYQRLVAEDKGTAKEVDKLIFQQKEILQEINNLKFVKEAEEKILSGYVK